MANYITIDGGTTNTRMSLVSDGKIIQTLAFGVGARNGRDALKATVRNGISEILENNGIGSDSISCILAGGMITSEFGLVELEHIILPCGIEELHNGMHRCTIEDITDIPFVFARGIKTECRDLESADMMRGEECELMGIFSGEGVYILPGSHSKIIRVDSDGRVTDFETMLTGEMISAIASDTILKDAVALKNFEINEEYLVKGFEYADVHGINSALFKVRIAKNLFGKSEEEIYAFYLGIILCDEIKYILAQKPERIVIGGRLAIKNATAILLEKYTDANITVLSEDEVKGSSMLGMIRIYEYSAD